MASAAKTTGVAAAGVATVAGIAALVSSLTPSTVPGLAIIAVSGAQHGQGINQTPNAVVKYGMPGPDDLVRRCLPAGCNWIDTDMYWSKFINVMSDEAVDTCQTPLKVDTAAPIPWTADNDPCKAWKAVPPAQVPNTVEKAAANGAWMIWKPVNTNVDGSSIAGAVSYRVYRSPKMTDNRIDSGTASFVVETNNINALIKKQPTGSQCYAVSAKTVQGESMLSNGICKVMKIPAPSNGKIEGPSNGSIEIK